MMHTLIKRNRFTLVQEMISMYKLHYDPSYTATAIKADAFDILFLFKKEYPNSYMRDEDNHMRAFVDSLSYSNSMWVAKIHFLKSLADKMKY
jgi:hypothetical protein